MRRSESSRIGSWLATAVCCAIVLASAAIADEGMNGMDRRQAHKMLRLTREQIEKYYFDPKFGGVDLAAAYAIADARIDAAKNLPDAFSAIAQFTIELNDSHTIFFPPRQTVDVLYGWSMQTVGDVCYIVGVKPGSDAAKQGVGVGDRVDSVNGFRPARENLWTIKYLFYSLRPQPGLHMVLQTPQGVVRELDLAAEVRPRSRITDLSDSAGIQRMWMDYERAALDRISDYVPIEPDVLIWRLATFRVDNAVIDRSIKAARKRQSLVLDLRGNGGGAERAVLALIGGLTQKDTLVGTNRGREGDKPLEAHGAGEGAFDGKLVVLVDSRSASASEIVARAVQLNGRGTVLGDRTAGSVRRSRNAVLDTFHGEYFAVFGVNVTIADVLMRDGGRLERVGVTPDREILPSADDLASGRDPVLAEALTLLGHPTDATQAGKLLKPRNERD